MAIQVSRFIHQEYLLNQLMNHIDFLHAEGHPKKDKKWDCYFGWVWSENDQANQNLSIWLEDQISWLMGRMINEVELRMIIVIAFCIYSREYTKFFLFQAKLNVYGYLQENNTFRENSNIHEKYEYRSLLNFFIKTSILWK